MAGGKKVVPDGVGMSGISPGQPGAISTGQADILRRDAQTAEAGEGEIRLGPDAGFIGSSPLARGLRGSNGFTNGGSASEKPALTQNANSLLRPHDSSSLDLPKLSRPSNLGVRKKSLLPVQGRSSLSQVPASSSVNGAIAGGGTSVEDDLEAVRRLHNSEEKEESTNTSRFGGG
eukprot:CAMPEP_0113896916 /NCGR_PEP_ID=MMETSP0780_2-20120614/18334_1 /TAXON_ID=652834 /ORGANISM="Palpitomonas bilix" /LENGTH=174 /DNA_ID=CAMNT_0000888211 /DNA_START=124 /DNA_END=645 /DNA_ORIENTATION=- /assembly_acc=CAM_ASM_000599